MYKNFSLLSTAAIASVFAIGSLTSPAQAQLANSGNLTAEVSALRNKTGQVCFSLFDSSKGFPNNDESIVETKCVSAEASEEASTEASEETSTEALEDMTEAISVTFESLPLGTYAVTVFHDENEDGEMNQGSFGIPLEGFGFSKNPAVTTRAPEFSETAIILVSRETTTEIELIYY